MTRSRSLTIAMAWSTTRDLPHITVTTRQFYLFRLGNHLFWHSNAGLRMLHLHCADLSSCPKKPEKKPFRHPRERDQWQHVTSPLAITTTRF